MQKAACANPYPRIRMIPCVFYFKVTGAEGFVCSWAQPCAYCSPPPSTSPSPSPIPTLTPGLHIRGSVCVCVCVYVWGSNHLHPPNHSRTHTLSWRDPSMTVFCTGEKALGRTIQTTNVDGRSIRQPILHLHPGYHQCSSYSLDLFHQDDDRCLFFTLSLGRRTIVSPQKFFTIISTW